jgi:hypothetical protein
MKNKKKSGEKLVFIIIIVIFALSSVLAYASVSMKSPAPELTKPEVQQKELIAKDLLNKGINPDQNLTGVVRKLDPGMYSEGTHYLEADGITLAILETTDSSINMDKYVGENVKVWGDSRQITEGDGAIMSVKKIEIAN